MSAAEKPGAASTHAEKIDWVVAREPRLTDFGFGVYDEQRLSPAVRLEKFIRERAAMYETERIRSGKGFEDACEFLSHVEPIVGFNRRSGSYGLKHVCEDWSGRYLTNGIFIAAAIYCGFKWKETDPGSPNAFFNFSQRSLDAMNGESSRRKSERELRRKNERERADGGARP